MSELPERTLRAAKDGFKSGYTDYEGHCRDALTAAMDPALGADRLVVAGPFEREVAELRAKVERYREGWLSRGRQINGTGEFADAASDAAYDPSNPSRRT